MPDDRTTYASEQEIAQLRDDIRRLREDQQRLNELRSNGRDEPDERDRKSGQGDRKEEPKKPHPLRNALLLVAAVLLVGIGFVWWLHARQFEGTDDAIVDGHTSGIASRISGTVVAVRVEENQFVKAGQVMVELDPRDYQAASDQAQGQLRQAEAQSRAEQPNIPVTQVTNETNIATTASAVSSAEAAVVAAERNYEAALDKVREAQATNLKAQGDVRRYAPLAAKEEISHEQFDQVVANAKAMQAAVEANQASAQAAQRQVDQSREQLRQARDRASEAARNAPREIAIRQATLAGRQGAVAAARAQLAQAMLNLSYCKIATPVNGIVAKRVAEVGQHLTPGQQVLLITQLDDLWVTANFRETQLRRMHAGQSVRIHVDALGRDFDGYVESMPAASGAVTSLLPPENATGNFVKIVQRLPVRIRFRKDQAGLELLRPGMSVEPKVRVG